MDNQRLIRLESLAKQYVPGEPFALKEVNLSLDEGEFVAVLGLSGSGKSTLIRCINRLIEPTTGKIYWQGREVLSLKGEELQAYRRGIGMIFQDFHLIDRLSVLENALVGSFGRSTFWRAVLGRPTSDVLARAQTALERVGLGDFQHRKVRDLSGGQRQRVAIARALTQDPLLILGDEPVSNLDPLTAVAIMRLLKRINRESGITFLINLHSVELAVNFASRVIGIAEGRIVFDGAPTEVNDQILQRIYSRQGDEEVALNSKLVASMATRI